MIGVSKLPSGWVLTKLGDVIGSIKGKKPLSLTAENNNSAVPYINIEAFEKRVFTQYTHESGLPLCNPKDVLIVWDGARCGLVGKGASGVIGSTLAKLIANELDTQYLYYFLKANYETINKRPRGVGIPHVEPNVFWNISFPLAPLPEQHRIVTEIEELFTRLDVGVDALNKVKLQLKRYRQSVLKAAFEGKLTAEWREAHQGEIEPASVLLEKIKTERIKSGKYKELPPLDTSELAELPEGWAWERASALCDLITNGDTPEPQKMFSGSGQIPFIKVYNLTNIGKLNFAHKPTFINYETHNTELNRSKTFPGDILMNIVGPPLGKVSIVPDIYSEWNINQAIVIFRPCHFFDRKLLSYALLTKSVLGWAEKTAKATAGQFNLTLTTCRNLPLPVAPLLEQQKIVQEIERCFSVIDEIEKTIDEGFIQSERLRQSILKQAFEGKLVAQDPNDEPAEKLLERIKAEKIKTQADTITGKKKTTPFEKRII